MGFSRDLVVKKDLPANSGDVGLILGFNPQVRKIPWRRKWQPAPVWQLTPGFLPEKFHEQRSLAGYSPWGTKSWSWLNDWACTMQCYKNIYDQLYFKNIHWYDNTHNIILSFKKPPEYDTYFRICTPYVFIMLVTAECPTISSVGDLPKEQIFFYTSIRRPEARRQYKQLIFFPVKFTFQL